MCGAARDGARLLLQPDRERCHALLHRQDLHAPSQLRPAKQANWHRKAPYQHRQPLKERLRHAAQLRQFLSAP